MDLWTSASVTRGVWHSRWVRAVKPCVASGGLSRYSWATCRSLPTSGVRRNKSDWQEYAYEVAQPGWLAGWLAVKCFMRIIRCINLGCIKNVVLSPIIYSLWFRAKLNCQTERGRNSWRRQLGAAEASSRVRRIHFNSAGLLQTLRDKFPVFVLRFRRSDWDFNDLSSENFNPARINWRRLPGQTVDIGLNDSGP